MILVTRWDEISGDGGENSVWRSLYVCACVRACVCVCADWQGKREVSEEEKLQLDRNSAFDTLVDWYTEWLF